ncbi:MAG: flagellar hook-basal body complex protein [Devosia sp.]|uniref:flagellar hook protein FlgE n=1 Tax=Devosia sp. TaxID=1871048 RepID=UPI001A3D5857|nr:flagellar hook-basal body complex protein [Devosia sp.]MBL8597489.1 flagellar hook-basal body complex protein [Devosia sp.]
MGIYGALSTAVTGLRAQSFALENISGNIANSQTTGFKRIDTDFVDLIPDQPRKLQSAGSVLAQSRSTNTLQGDVKSVSNSTYMAVNGSGFFVVEPSIGQSDGNSLFAGTNFYTRRGDFDVDKNGYLVNGSGYYLKGLPVDPATGNLSSSLPQVLRLSNNFLPAQQTTRVNYQLNLPLVPQTAEYREAKTPGSELLNSSDFMTLTPDTPAAKLGAAGVSASTTSASLLANGQSITITEGSNPAVTFNFTNSGANTATTFNITDPASDTLGEIMALMNAQLAPNSSVSINSNGQLTLTGTGTAPTDTLTVAGTSGLAFDTTPAAPTVSAALSRAQRPSPITAAQAADFNAQTISGGTVTVFTSTGAPADVQLRWAKNDSASSGSADTWSLYYLQNGAATGSQPMWTRVPQDFSFGTDGALSPEINEVNLTGLTIDGVSVGSLKLDFGTDGITQFNDPNGTAGVTALSQNGYPAGEFVSVAVNDNGRVVVAYSNNQQVEVAQVITANFNAANQLKRLDGGIFAETADSGSAILDTSGGVVSSALESSNTDISEEFTKLIVTQQAYAAGTRIVSTADQMIQEALNMIR